MIRIFAILSAGFILLIISGCPLKKTTVSKTSVVEKTEPEKIFQQAQTYLKDQGFEKALELLYEIVEDFPEDELADDALYLIADILSNPQNPDQDIETAIDELERLIDEYPQSRYRAKAEKKIKKLEKLLEE